MDEVGPSCRSPERTPYVSVHLENDSNVSVTEQLSIAAVRDMFAKQCTELERERKLREQLEQKSADLARQLHEQQMRMGTHEVSGPSHRDVSWMSGHETPPSAPLQQASDNDATSCPVGSPVLPDSIPIIIDSCPYLSSHVQDLCCTQIDMQRPCSSNSLPGVALHTSCQPTPSPAAVEDQASCSRAVSNVNNASGWDDDITVYQRQLEAHALEAFSREAQDELMAIRLQTESAKEAAMLKKRQSDVDAEIAARLAAEEQQIDQELAARDAKLAAEAWAAEQKGAEEARLREQQDLEAAQRAQEEEERRMQEEQEARQAQVAENERVAQLLDTVSKATLQDIDDLDRAAVLADHDGEPMFECPVLKIECSKLEEGECVGQWSKATCNHWISKEALVQYICTQAEDQPFRMRCPVCAVARCDRCTLHSTNPRDEGCCCIPPRQIRAVLSEDQMARLLYLQEQGYRNVHKDRIVQCPHPDCRYFYALEDEDARQADPGDGGEQSRWREGQDMWCGQCEVRYCLHCGDHMGTLVRWHDGKTCTEFLQDTENAKTAAERKRLEKVANEGHEQNRGKTWQRCPKCGYEAWKADGQCNRVVCKEHCATNFCFLCGEDITKQRYRHYEDGGHPCHNKVWHIPLAGADGRPACKCASCRRQARA